MSGDDFHYNLGRVYFEMGQYKEAAQEFQLTLKSEVFRYQALNLMGLCFLKRNMLDLAVRQLVHTKSELPFMDEIKKEVTYNLGLSYVAAKQSKKALEQFKEIYEYDMSYRDVARRVEDSYGSGDGDN